MAASHSIGLNAAKKTTPNLNAKKVRVIRFLYLNAEFFAAPFCQPEIFQVWAAQFRIIEAFSQALWEAIDLHSVDLLTFAQGVSGLVYDDIEQLKAGKPSSKTLECLLYHDSDIIEKLIMRTNSPLFTVFEKFSRSPSLKKAIDAWYDLHVKFPRYFKERAELNILRQQIRALTAQLDEGSIAEIFTAFERFSAYLKLKQSEKSHETIHAHPIRYAKFFSLLAQPSLLHLKSIYDAAFQLKIDDSDLIDALQAFQILKGVSQNDWLKLQKEIDLNDEAQWFYSYAKNVASALLLIRFLHDSKLQTEELNDIENMITKSETLMCKLDTTGKGYTFMKFIKAWSQILALSANNLLQDYFNNCEITVPLTAMKKLIFTMDQVVDVLNSERAWRLDLSGMVAHLGRFVSAGNAKTKLAQEVIDLHHKIYELDMFKVLTMQDIAILTTDDEKTSSISLYARP
jgi:hypothetical protein